MTEIKTIKRRKSWPAWARWCATDQNGSAWIYAEQPTMQKWRYDGLWRSPTHESTEVHGPRIVPWDKSLRRIAP